MDPKWTSLNNHDLILILEFAIYLQQRSNTERRYCIAKLTDEATNRGLDNDDQYISYCDACKQQTYTNKGHDCPNTPCIQCDRVTEGGYCEACDTDA